MTEPNSAEPAPFFANAFRDIGAYDAAIARQGKYLEEVRQQIARLRAQLEAAPTRPCPFCSENQRDLSALIESGDAFGHLGGTYSSLESARDYLKLVPTQWECQGCGTFDVDPPGDGVRTWSRTELPSPGSVARRMLDAFTSAEDVALLEDTHGTHWMLLVADVWYVLPGTGSQVVERLGSRNSG